MISLLSLITHRDYRNTLLHVRVPWRAALDQSSCGNLVEVGPQWPEGRWVPSIAREGLAR